MRKWYGWRTAMSIGLCFHNPRSRLPSTSLELWSPRCRTFTSWSTSTVWVGPSMRRLSLICAALCLVACSLAGMAQDLRVPASVTAGDEATIPTTGSGKATFYLLGPGISRKGDVNLGEEIHLQAKDLRNAGDYLALVCSDTCHSGTFYVMAAKPASLTFLVHPSRVPVAQDDAVSGVTFTFDQFRNLVLTPATVTFQLTAGDKSLLSRPARTQNGVAWFRTASGKSAGLLQVVATLDDLSARRAVQQVA